MVWSATYVSHGEASIDSDPDGYVVTSNLRFIDQYHDAVTVLHYNYFRYYDPSIGRYITSDPIGLDSGLNIDKNRGQNTDFANIVPDSSVK